jgi:hypothetical protein
MHGERQNFDIGAKLGESPRQLKATEIRQRELDDSDIRPGFLNHRECLTPRGGRADHRGLVSRAQQRRNAGKDNRMIVGKGNSNSHSDAPCFVSGT